MNLEPKFEHPACKLPMHYVSMKNRIAVAVVGHSTGFNDDSSFVLSFNGSGPHHILTEGHRVQEAIAQGSKKYFQFNLPKNLKDMTLIPGF